MPGTKYPTVRSGGTTSVRSAFMPTLMTSRASMMPKLLHATTSSLPGAQLRVRRRDDKGRLFLGRRGGAFHEGLAALHLMRQRRFVDLDHDRIGIDAEVL